MCIVTTLTQQLSDIDYPEKRVRTSLVRSISASGFRTLENKAPSVVFEHCEVLLAERDWALSLIAFDWAFRMKPYYDNETFARFESWLYQYITDWNDCDDFCTHALGALIAQDNSLFERTLKWTKSDNFAVRRAAAVSLIYPINKGMYGGTEPFKVANRLLEDEHDLVQKGYGWMLKVLAQKEPNSVIEYLKCNHSRMPRTAFRYAIEKLDKQTKQRLMAL
ncbi:DNA alkylation repair protein [Vibrio hyugaensis]|uniref:DNA alkylation repair protein n=1 Tax=Vibrio hyugaensis TaxID=1534743 RepID=UPI0005F09460|nr:DNA alkylation repair protein [Vibrio hyugaensis]